MVYLETWTFNTHLMFDELDIKQFISSLLEIVTRMHVTRSQIICKTIEYPVDHINSNIGPTEDVI